MRDDALLPATRVTAWIVAPFLLAAGCILYLFPDRTAQLWAWPIDPPMSALAIGGGYLAGAVLFLRALRAGRWHQLAVGLVAATVLASLLLLATVLHWDKFMHGHVSFWSWALLYAVTPPALPLLWGANRRRDPGPVATPTVGPVVRRVVATFGAGLLAVALLLFVRPALVIDSAPWVLTPLTVRTISAFLAFLSVSGLAFLVEARWSALRLHIETSALGLAFVGLGALRATGDFTGPTWSIWLFAVALVGTLAGMVWLLLWMRGGVRRTGQVPTQQP